MKLALAFLTLITVEVFRGRSQPQSCLSSTNELADLENAVQDFSQFRSYTLCPELIYQIARRDYSNELISTTGTAAIPIRPNLEIKCGVNGSRSNNCFVYGGDVQVDATGYFGISNGSSLSVENVLISGFTFVDSRGHSVWATRPGNMTFRDCEFRMNRKALASVYLDYFDPSTPNEELAVSFEECEFSNNVYFGEPAETALVVGNSAQTRINITDSVFQGNDLVFNNTLSATNSFLIESSGPLKLERNCFMDNTLGVSVAVVYGVPLEASDNYGSNSSGGSCEFAAVFDTEEQLQNFTPQCLNFDASSCLASLVATVAPAYPSDSPSLAPTRLPSLSPSWGPTQIPSIAPSSRPSFLTGFPSVSPSYIPSVSPSSNPSLLPSFAPSAVPSKRPKPSSKRIRTEFPTPEPSEKTSAAFGSSESQVWAQLSTFVFVVLALFG